MIIIKSVGGLGNQLFQYALYMRLQTLGKIVKIDFSQLYKDNIQNELTIFGNEILQPSPKEIAELGDCAQNVFSKVRRKLGIKKKSYIEEKANYTYDPEILSLDNVYLFGYWQTEKYFVEIRDNILQALRFPAITEPRNIEYEKRIKNCQTSVSLHVRRGDYLINKFKKRYGGICTNEYYEKAVGYFKQKYPEAHFFVFTNDEEWVSKQFQSIDMTIIKGNAGKLSYRDMQLMSMCQHNIIANSSFSWWGAWLNQNQNKEVIMPPMWNRVKETPDIWVPGWIKLDTPVEEF